jgi:predicted dehydrogenase
VAVKQHLPSLGRLIAINGLWTIYKPSSYFDPPTDWRRLDSAGPIFINLIHEIDLLHYWYGPITRVYAEQTVSQRGFDAEEGAAITLRFASGLVGTFLLSDAVVSPHSFEGGTGENPIIPCTGQDFHRAFGSEGSLSVPDMTLWEYREGENSWTTELTSTNLEVPEMKIPFEAQVEHFLKVIRGEESASCNGAEGLRAVVVCEAIKQSIKEHRPIEIEIESRT